MKTSFTLSLLQLGWQLLGTQSVLPGEEGGWTSVLDLHLSYLTTFQQNLKRLIISKTRRAQGEAGDRILRHILNCIQNHLHVRASEVRISLRSLELPQNKQAGA